MRVRMLTAAMALAVVVSTGRAAAQGHGYTPQDIELGGTLYMTACAGCHGPDGDAVPGLNLGAGKFRRATTDEQVAQIIMGGIPGTGMPPHPFNEYLAGTIVAYLRSLAASAAADPLMRGDASRGRTIFEGKGKCQTCHAVAGVGARLGPALTDIGAVRRGVELRRSVVDPSSEVRSDNRSVRAVTRQGATVTGRLLNHDAFTVQLLDAGERLIVLEKADLKEYGVLKDSPMPSYRNTLDDRELADLVTYLTSLRGRP
jgi:putative heme-binding domain-containing protein